jgi:PAS domain S-box-containing protein
MDISQLPWQEIITSLIGMVTILLSIGNSKLKKILAETKTNGGSSLKDQLNRIENHVTNLTLWTEAGQHLTAKPMFKSDQSGRFIWINTAFARMVGVGLEDLKGLGWLSYISDKDQTRVSEEWEESVKDGRRFEATFSIKNIYSQEEKQVKARAFPVQNDKAILGFIGTWITIEELIED